MDVLLLRSDLEYRHIAAVGVLEISHRPLEGDIGIVDYSEGADVSVGRLAVVARDAVALWAADAEGDANARRTVR